MIFERIKLLRSKVDDTTNTIYPDGSEFRCVERLDNTTFYLSSHTGCSLACKMCHLTANGDTKMLPLSADDILTRATTLIANAEETTKPANFSFMAKGDALASKSIDADLVDDLMILGDQHRRLHTKVVISTIFPRQTVGDKVDEFLFDRFKSYQPHLYWSLYSLDPTFREYWLPNAQDPEIVAAGLARWQKRTAQEVVIHHPLIDSATLDFPPSNISGESVIAIGKFLDKHDLHYRINLVRYNPPSSPSASLYEYGLEAHQVDYNMHTRVYETFPRCTSVKIQERVGPDVSASCGMFLERDK